MSVDINDLVLGDIQLSSLPEVFYQLKEALETPDVSFDEIGEIIKHDPPLTARMLKIVNSSFYGFPQEIETLPHALSIIGIDQLSDLVFATTVLGRFTGVPPEVINVKAFWKHSICCGLGARVIGSMLDGYNDDIVLGRLFIAGLLHDIGRLVVCKRLPKEAKQAYELCNEKGIMLVEAEQGTFGLDHAQVGMELLKAWNLPPKLSNIVRHHHDPNQYGSDDKEAAILYGADVIAYSLGLAGSGECHPPKINDVDWGNLGLNPAKDMPKVLNQIKNQFNETAKTFLHGV